MLYLFHRSIQVNNYLFSNNSGVVILPFRKNKSYLFINYIFHTMMYFYLNIIHYYVQFLITCDAFEVYFYNDLYLT